MIILGIDPGIATLGYGVVEKDINGNCRAVDYGVVVTPKDETLPVRLALLEEGVTRILEKFQPDEIALEELFFSKNITTGIAVAHARGVTLLACVKQCGKLFEYTPMQIKQALTGYGRAEKKQMQQVVASLLKLESIPRPDDAADALAIALCHAFTSRFGNLFAVGNTTRTKGHNTVTGEAFQSMMQEEQTRAPRKRAASKKVTANGTPKTPKAVKTVKTPSLTKPVKTVKSVKAQTANTSKTTAKKTTGQGVNSAAAIAKALFEKSGNSEN
ncbi:MAG: crossover junction endodeoxyribonuclease RuvC [Clostridia bacterium]|nr:crossover junction endodeoxyribonuclease RuvC [Clostridia bacterium]